MPAVASPEPQSTNVAFSIAVTMLIAVSIANSFSSFSLRKMLVMKTSNALNQSLKAVPVSLSMVSTVSRIPYQLLIQATPRIAIASTTVNRSTLRRAAQPIRTSRAGAPIAAITVPTATTVEASAEATNRSAVIAVVSSATAAANAIVQNTPVLN